MAVTLTVNGVDYPCISVVGKIKDTAWDNRESKYITLEMKKDEVFDIFTDGIEWGISEYFTKNVAKLDEEGGLVFDEHGNIVMETMETSRQTYDNSEYCILGDIAFHPDGTCTVAMGKPTETEKMQEQLANTVTGEELAAAYNEGVNSL